MKIKYNQNWNKNRLLLETAPVKFEISQEQFFILS